mmetsp:Transcript_60796/g.69481  ORF Transcript_60796/g.69481 Transcript_60796/m.69481 type:complete len:83 (-) Transcript_60796:142-390(-)
MNHDSVRCRMVCPFLSPVFIPTSLLSASESPRRFVITSFVEVALDTKTKKTASHSFVGKKFGYHFFVVSTLFQKIPSATSGG